MFEDFLQCQDWVRSFRQRFPTPPATMHRGHDETSMSLDGYGASVMLAPRLKGDGRHRLPSGVPAPAYPVAEYEACPRDWRKTRDAFFAPVPLGLDGKGPGMWYDWTMNERHTHNVAVLPSTTGLNPITGRKTDALRLEHYKDRCPLHDAPFEGDRFCKQCNFRHPPQNYVAGPNRLWWDGFRRADGTVEQFWFSDEVLKRDVGVAVLGGERVPAFGFAFFRSVQPKPVPVASVGRVRSAGAVYGLEGHTKGGGGMLGLDGPKGLSMPAGPSPRALFARRAAAAAFSPPPPTAMPPSVPYCDADLGEAFGLVPETTEEAFHGEPTESDLGGETYASCAFVSVDGMEGMHEASLEAPQPEPESAPEPPAPPQPPIGESLGEIRRAAIERAVAVGRGAQIEQDIIPDPRSLSEWQEKPAAVITVYFVPERVAVAILQGPKRDLRGDPAGWLWNVGVSAGAE